jgi:GntR family transcriptional regulator / MocR family aminotransferase
MPTEWASSRDLLLSLDASHGLRLGIESAIRQAIQDGRLRPGEKLPSSRSLARDLGVARGTVSEAYSQLAAEGYLGSRQGAASQVVWAPPARSVPAARPAEQAARWDLRPGLPGGSSFPRHTWARAARRVLPRIPEDAFGYGDCQGTAELRVALASYLGRARNVRSDPAGLMICGGFTEALAIVCEVLRRSGATAMAMEDPCAPRYRQIVSDAGLRVVPVACDGEGIQTAALARTPAQAVLVTPAHQYPLGVTLSPGRRGALIEWARARDGLVVEDDYDGEFRFGRPPVGALQQMDPDHVVYVGTASKTLGPGLRLGWMTLPPPARDPARQVKERLNRGNAVIDQFVLADLIGSGEFDRHVRRLRAAYRRRRDQLLAALAGSVPGAVVTGIAAGMHLLLRPPGEVSGEAILAAAQRHSLWLHTLADYQHFPAAPGSSQVIVGYGTPADHAFRPALDALMAVLTSLPAGA